VPLATAVTALWWPSHSAAPGASTVLRDSKFSPNAYSCPISTRVIVAVLLQWACLDRDRLADRTVQDDRRQGSQQGRIEAVSYYIRLTLTKIISARDTEENRAKQSSPKASIADQISLCTLTASSLPAETLNMFVSAVQKDCLTIGWSLGHSFQTDGLRSNEKKYSSHLMLLACSERPVNQSHAGGALDFDKPPKFAHQERQREMIGHVLGSPYMRAGAQSA
jgi:hypothetical protein